MITLYYAPQTRASSILWLLEELEAPYRTKVVGFRGPDGAGLRDPENPHPHGKVPALLDGDELVFEGSAIALYLTDRYRKRNLGPAVGESKRAEYLSWLAYRPGVMEPAFVSRRFGIKHRFGPMAWAPADEVEEVLNRRLASRKYFLGDEFSALDILLGGSIDLLLKTKVLKHTPVLNAYAARAIDRPSYRKMVEIDKNLA